MDESLSSLYSKADILRHQVNKGIIVGDPKVYPNACHDLIQTKSLECIALFQKCKELVERSALFSPNESVDDVASSELKYFQPIYHLF